MFNFCLFLSIAVPLDSYVACIDVRGWFKANKHFDSRGKFDVVKFD